MSTEILYRRDAPLPYQTWHPFPPEAIVQVWSYVSSVPPKIAQAKDLWWGYEDCWCDGVNEGVIARARRLDRPKQALGGKDV